MLDMHRLRVFRSVVATGSINAAAANLGYTASAVSQQSRCAAARDRPLARGPGRPRHRADGCRPGAGGGDRRHLLHRLGDVEALVSDLRRGAARLAVTDLLSVGRGRLDALGRAGPAARLPRLRLRAHHPRRHPGRPGRSGPTCRSSCEGSSERNRERRRQKDWIRTGGTVPPAAGSVRRDPAAPASVRRPVRRSTSWRSRASSGSTTIRRAVGAGAPSRRVTRPGSPRRSGSRRTTIRWRSPSSTRASGSRCCPGSPPATCPTAS